LIEENAIIAMGEGRRSTLSILSTGSDASTENFRNSLPKSVRFSSNLIPKKIFHMETNTRSPGNSLDENRQDEDEVHKWALEIDAIPSTHSGEMQQSFLKGAVLVRNKRESSFWTMLSSTTTNSPSLFDGSSSLSSNNSSNRALLDVDLNELRRNYSISIDQQYQEVLPSKSEPRTTTRRNSGKLQSFHLQQAMESRHSATSVPERNNSSFMAMPSLERAATLDPSTLSNTPWKQQQAAVVEEEQEKTRSSASISLSLIDDQEEEEEGDALEDELNAALQVTRHQQGHLEEAVRKKERTSNVWKNALPSFLWQDYDPVDVNAFFREQRLTEGRHQSLSMDPAPPPPDLQRYETA
jgi:hypothetical protein